MIDIDDLKRMVFLLEHAQQNGELSEVAAFNLPVYKMALRATELEAERDALAVENAALKGLVEERCWVYDYDVEGYRDAHDYLPDTPTTDAYANQLRAEGVEMFANHFNCADIGDDILEFAANLRAGKDGE